jgi:hypothetical protein
MVSRDPGERHLNFSGPFSIYSASKFKDLEGEERKAGERRKLV